MLQLPAARRHRRPRAYHLRRLGALVAALVAVVAVAGCSTIEAFTDLTNALRSEGFTDVNATVEGGDPVVLAVKADAPSGTDTDEALDEATQIIWTTFPRRFDVLQVTIDGEGRRLDYAEIEEDLGARPARLDETDLTDEVTRLSLGLIVGLAAGVVLVALLVGLVILIATRRRRRRGVIGGPPPTGIAAWAPPVGSPGAPGMPGGPTPPTWGPQTGPPPAPPPGWVPPPPQWAPPAGPTPPPSGFGPSTPGPAVPVPPPTAEDRAKDRSEARRIGRRPRGPRPPATQVPPGWG